MNILFINDGSFYSGLVTELLCFNGYTIYEANHVARVEEVLNQKQVDVVLCYVPFAAVTSLTWLAELHARNASLPLLAITSHPMGSEVHQHLSRLGSICLTIPFASELLLQRISEVTGIKKRIVRICLASASPYLSPVAAVAIG